MSEQQGDPSNPQQPTSSTNEPYTPKPQQPPPQPTAKSQSTSSSAKSSSDQFKEFIDFIGDFFAWLGELLVSGIKFIFVEIDKARIASTQKNPVSEEQQIQSVPVTDQPAQTESHPATINSYNVNNLGYYLDGWADLIEGMGSKAEEVRKKVHQGLLERDMPARIGITVTNAFVSVASTERRPYVLTWTRPGASTTIFVETHGKDLFTSWRTFIKPVLNVTAILVMLLIAGTLGVVALANEVNVREFSDYIDYFDQWFSFTGWLLRSILVLLFEFLIVAFVGRVMKGNFLAFFFIEPTVFDAEDITAMSLTAHKTLLRALDSSGIDVTKLRLKQNFKGGRRDEMI